MTLQELLDKLSEVKDKTLPVSISTDNENLWVHDLSVRQTGETGYEIEGTVELSVSE